MNLDGTKIDWHMDRVKAWERGEKISPITIDMSLTQSCNMACKFCYGVLQKNENTQIKKDHITAFLHDCAILNIKGVSLVSDGESTIHPNYEYMIGYGKKLGIDMASGTNGYLLNKFNLYTLLRNLTYLRFNISAGEKTRYTEIMGAKDGMFDQVIQNISTAVRIKKDHALSCTIGMQMVLMPEFSDQILPLSKLAIRLGVDYLVIKHCSDDENGSIGVDYRKYKDLYTFLKSAENLSTDLTKIVVKWSKLKDGNIRRYSRCIAPPFIIQISGSGVVAPCGMLFGKQYEKYHIGNITKDRFIDIVRGDKYWSVMNELKSKNFNAKTMCGSLCLQHCTNKALDSHVSRRAIMTQQTGEKPEHVNFI